MKRISIALEEEVVRWVRTRAAEHDTSVSRFVGDLLKQQMNSEAAYRRSQGRFLRRKPERLKADGAYPRRDDLRTRE